MLAYAAPITGAFFFYMPMWSVLPGLYAKYFGLPMSSIAAVILSIRVFDGLIIPAVGYLSDRHRAGGGSPKIWLVVGYSGVIVACHFLFSPPQPASVLYYLGWSIAYFSFAAIGDIPYLTWGNELTLDYQRRAKIVALRGVMFRVGIVAFYALPFLPIYAVSEYTPQVLHDGVYVGGALIVAGLLWAVLQAPHGVLIRTAREDSVRLFVRSIWGNKPLLLYFAAQLCVGISVGMWYGLLYFFMDSYLGLGNRIPLMFITGFALGALSTPLWLKLVRKTAKSVAWAAGLMLFAIQAVGAWLVTPGMPWWIALALVIVANLTFAAHDVAGVAIVGDIVDYGKLRFNKDRGSTYVSFTNLVFQVSLGIGGGFAIGVAAHFGFSATASVHSIEAIQGLKLGFSVSPLVFSVVAAFLILRTPITRARHRIIQRRLESRPPERGRQYGGPVEGSRSIETPLLKAWHRGSGGA